MYHKIKTVFKRDPENKYKTLLHGEFALPEFEYLKDNQWIFTEKVDGTNIRVMWNHKESILNFGGKTSRAEIPKHLLNQLLDMFAGKFKIPYADVSMCLYGEGYGYKIQKGGKYISNATSFVLFDVKVGEWWLQQKDVVDVAFKLNIDVVPVVGIGTLYRMVEIVKSGFNSHWGDFKAEGLVARPYVELKARNGQRIITKIKYKDFNNVS